MTLIIIGTRGSELALWQANFLQTELKSKCGIDSELKIIQTKGDKIQDLSFDKIEGKGFFTKELEDALINEEIDIAVHSMKDMPSIQPDGLILAGISSREDCRDTLIISKSAYSPEEDLRIKKGAIIGTSSVRRKAQLLALKSEIELKDLRGNVPTRINKLKNGEYDAIVLARAGLNRLGLDLSEFETIDLHPSEFVPAPAQGVLVYQCRTDDIQMRKVISTIHDEEANQCVRVERKILKMMEGGCQVPLGVHCHKDVNGYFHVYAAYTPSLDKPIIKIRKSQSTTFNLAEEVIKELKK